MARRQDLLRKRRDELVTMPHTIRRVVVSREARAAASMAAIVCGVAMISLIMIPTAAKFVASGLPGINPAVLSTALSAAWVLGLVAFAISRGRTEHRYAVAMSTYVLPGDDLDHDIERLSHERPDRVARAMAHRSEVRSAALPVVAAAFILPATLAYFAHAARVGGWPSTAEFEMNLASSGQPLLACALAGVVAGIMMTRSWMRSDRIAPIAAMACLFTSGLAVTTLWQREADLAWAFTALSVITGAMAFVNFRLRSERKALEIEDPAAGSELFTLRGFYESVKTTALAARRHISPKMAVGLGAFALLLVCAGDRMTSLTPTKTAAAAAPRTSLVNPKPAVLIPGKSSLIKATPLVDGRIRYEVRFVDGKPLTLPDLASIQVLPLGWRARVVVSAPEGLVTPVAVSPFPGNREVYALHLSDDAREHRFSFSACDGDTDLGLELVPDAGAPQELVAMFIVEPTLELAPCALQ